MMRFMQSKAKQRTSGFAIELHDPQSVHPRCFLAGYIPITKQLEIASQSVCLATPETQVLEPGLHWLPFSFFVPESGRPSVLLISGKGGISPGEPRAECRDSAVPAAPTLCSRLRCDVELLKLLTCGPHMPAHWHIVSAFSLAVADRWMRSRLSRAL